VLGKAVCEISALNKKWCRCTRQLHAQPKGQILDSPRSRTGLLETPAGAGSGPRSVLKQAD